MTEPAETPGRSAPPDERRSSRSRPRWAPSALVLLAGLVPMLPYLVGLPTFGGLPRMDYWDVVAALATPSGWTPSLDAWLGVRSNEHHVTLPALVYRLNIAFTSGDNRGLAAFTLCCLSGILVLLGRALPEALRRTPRRTAASVLLLSLFVFNLAQAHNVVWGFSGTMWILANLLAVVAMVSLQRFARHGRNRWLVLAVASGALGAFTYSSNLSLWPALIAGGLLLRLPARGHVAVGAAAAAAYWFSIATYRKPGHHAELATDPLEVVGFALRYLGNLFSRDGTAALLWGCLGLAASAAFWARRATRETPLPWSSGAVFLMLQVYALGNAIGTAVGRSGFPGDFSLSSRYANLSALFWIGLLVPLLAAATRHLPTERLPFSASLVGLVLLGFLAVSLFQGGWPNFVRYQERARTDPLFAYAVREGIVSSGGPVDVTNARLRQIVGHQEAMRAIGQKPFDRPSPFPVGEPSGLLVDEASPVTGALTTARRDLGRVFETSGWVAPADDVEWVLFLDYQGRVRGAALSAYPAARRQERPPGAAAWRGWVVLDRPRVVTPYAVVGEGEGAYLAPLEGTRHYTRDGAR